jgi:hypothetical protein
VEAAAETVQARPPSRFDQWVFFFTSSRNGRKRTFWEVMEAAAETVPARVSARFDLLLTRSRKGAEMDILGGLGGGRAGSPSRLI